MFRNDATALRRESREKKRESGETKKPKKQTKRISRHPSTARAASYLFPIGELRREALLDGAILEGVGRKRLETIQRLRHKSAVRINTKPSKSAKEKQRLGNRGLMS